MDTKMIISVGIGVLIALVIFGVAKKYVPFLSNYESAEENLEAYE